jgi:septal ring factor EnvC (AmiA/AmiB activator)
MTNEEMQSTMHFILEQQAQFAVNIQKLEESLQKLEESHAQFAVNLRRLEESQESLTRLVGEIAKAQARTEVNLARTEANLARTDANLARTDERLNNLITVFERYLSNHQNGKPQDGQ